MALVAVTGASGFIGREVVRRLLDQHAVRCAVRSPDRALAQWPPQCEVKVTGAIGPDTDWSELVSGANAVVHLAAIAHGKSSDPARIQKVNVEGARTLVVAAARAGVRRFVLLSSIGVHGDRTDSIPFTEASPYAPYDDYSRSKCEAEQAVVAAGKEYEIEVVIVRPPLVYGPHAPGNFGLLTGLVRRGIPLPFGSIVNAKSLVSVTNLSDFVAQVTMAPAAANEAYVICDGQDVSLPDLLRMMARAMGRRSRVVRFPPTLLRGMLGAVGRAEQLRKLSGSLVVDATKARQQLGWRAPETLAAGLDYALATQRR